MNSFKLKSNTVKSRKCIEVYSASDSLFCIIWADRQLSPQAFEFDLEEIEYFVQITENFHVTFENLELLAQKDQTIEELLAQIRQQEAEIESLINQPVNL